MLCPHCGTETAVVAGHCSRCGKLLSERGAKVAAGVLTAVPPDSLRPSELAIPRPPQRASADKPEPSVSPDDLTQLGQTSPTAGNGGNQAPRVTEPGPLESGQAFGTRYHVIRLLGIGGMGAVYQAWDDALGVSVALKVIRPPLSADPMA